MLLGIALLGCSESHLEVPVREVALHQDPEQASWKTAVEFELHNTGERDVTVELAAKSCGCLTATLPMVIKPGEERPLTVSIRRPRAGAFEETLRLKTTDPGNEFIDLVVRGDTGSRVSVRPQKLRMRNLVAGEPAEALISIMGQNRDRPFEVKGITDAAGVLEARLLTYRDEADVFGAHGRRGVFSVQPARSIQPGTHRGVLQIETSTPGEEHLTLDYEADVLAPLRVFPAHPVFRMGEQFAHGEIWIVGESGNVQVHGDQVDRFSSVALQVGLHRAEVFLRISDSTPTFRVECGTSVSDVTVALSGQP